MSEKSTKTETLSINFSGSMRTTDETLLSQFIDDVKELFVEWQTKTQITSLNIAVHDNREYNLIEEDKKPV